MDKRFLFRHAVLAFACMLFVIVLFDFTNIDMWVQNKLYQFGPGQWLLDKHDETLRLFFYDGPKKLLTLLAKIILLVLIVFHRNEHLDKYRQGLAIVLISTAVTVALVGGLKSLTNVPCPKDLAHFGGEYPYITFLHRIPLAEHLGRVRCFPAGHASGGFALLSLFFLFRRRRNQWIGFGVGMALGWTFGLYKMLIGDHFLSHTLVTMCLAWLVSVLVAAMVYRFSGRKDSQQDATAGESAPT
ncbi:phosphatase PAP2 family protein [Microbulbifer sp. SAOS-129_SWC]|uniref:phosphatase PAP2 family protein n=1 Tax=Microbulbifer sp. SAOS-129_SWC TaxID=3145235 RepID=UPI0032166792